MPIQITQPESGFGRFVDDLQEACCFCCKPTLTWERERTPKESVAVCNECANTHDPSELPTKREWCDREYAKRPPWQQRYVG